MRRNVASLFLQYARLDRKRSVDGLNPLEEEICANLKRYLTQTLSPNLPRGVEQRASIRVRTQLDCSFAPVATAHVGRITNLSRSGVFLCSESLVPIGERITIRIFLEGGSELTVPGVVANHFIGTEAGKRGMGVRFGPMSPDAMKVIDELYQHSIVSQFGKPEEGEGEAPVLDIALGDPE